MPVYEYQCGACSKRFDLFVAQRMGTDGVVCRHCHSTKVRKLVSVFASHGGANDLGGGEMSEMSAESSGGGCCGGSCGCSH